MIISRLSLKNWRNFKKIDIHLRDRVYVIGPNAVGKSNLLDVIRFLRDIAKSEGGGLQKAVKDRGGMTKLRCLMARNDPEISIEIEVSEKVDTEPTWKYTLGFCSEGRGQQRVLISQERVEKLDSGEGLLTRPNPEDKKDKDLLTQTHLEQINTNKEFRVLTEFLANVTYLHLVPQLLKHADQLGGYRLEDDPFGQAFLERIAKTPEKTQLARLRKISDVLKVCVPNMSTLTFKRDNHKGTPHLEALYEHWRPNAGWQREDQFSDGTLRLIGIMWSLLEGNSLLLLEEPELSLNEDIVRKIHKLLWGMQRQAKYRRQVFVTTHSEALLEDQSIDAREVIRLEPTRDGTVAHETSAEDQALISAGYTIAEVLLPKSKPGKVDQLDLFKP